jgi:hypothetical protein
LPRLAFCYPRRMPQTWTTWRREWDSNPRATFAAAGFQDRAPAYRPVLAWSCVGRGRFQSPRSTSPAIPGNGPQRPQARTDDAWGQTVVQGRRPAHPIRLFPNAITASVNPGNSAASFSATAAPGGTSISARPSTTAAITAHVYPLRRHRNKLSGSPGFLRLLSRTIGVSTIPGIINDAVIPLAIEFHAERFGEVDRHRHL